MDEKDNTVKFLTSILIILLAFIIILGICLKSCGKVNIPQTIQGNPYTATFDDEMSKTEVSFNELNEMVDISMSFFDEDSETYENFMKYSFEYNDNNQVIKQSNLYWDTENEEWTEDESMSMTFGDYIVEGGKVVSYSTFNLDGEKLSTTVLEYEDDLLISETTTYENDSIHEFTKWEYEYENSHLTKMTKKSSTFSEVPDYTVVYTLQFTYSSELANTEIYDKGSNHMEISITYSENASTIPASMLAKVAPIIVFDGMG